MATRPARGAGSRFSYLTLLEEAYLVAAIAKYSEKNARRRSSPPKLVTLNNALVAVMDPRGVAAADSDSARFGAWVENACLAHAWNAGQRVSYWREEPLRIDGVVEGSWGSWAIEVKTGKFQMSDLKALLEFVQTNRQFRPLVICRDTDRPTAKRAGVDSITWRGFLMEGPGGAR